MAIEKAVFLENLGSGFEFDTVNQLLNVNAAGFIKNIHVVSSTATLTEASALYIVDTADVVLDTLAAIQETPSFMYISNTSDGSITFEGDTILPGTKIGYIYNDATSSWEVFMADQGNTAAISHFVGFYSFVDANDSNITKFAMDLFPIVSGTSIDSSKYNLLFNDGTQSWMILAEAPEVLTVLDTDVLITTP